MSGDPVAQRPASPVTGRSVLITGGSGAFGQAFVRRCLEDGARRIVVYSRSESKQAAMKVALPDERIRYVIGDVRDGYRVLTACRNVDIVVHAAALKRVEVCAEHPREARMTNVMGTANVIDAAVHWGVPRCVLLSTDKAAAANTAYGASKAFAEFEWLGANALGAATATRFSCTRYGNVLGSTGSVVPTWRQQASERGGITITAPQATRFWMTMDDAVDLVLLALREMRGGEIFVPKIGASSVGALADALLPNTPWIHAGLRPSEKLHETLITDEESRRTHDCGSHYVIEPEGRPWGNVPEVAAPKVPEGFVYRSDTQTPMTADTLIEMAA